MFIRDTSLHLPTTPFEVAIQNAFLVEQRLTQTPPYGLFNLFVRLGHLLLLPCPVVLGGDVLDANQDERKYTF
ncbi:hypothetical protein Bca4012_025140 [Brassica carinata]